MISSNTDAVQFEIDDTYLNEVQQVIDSWQKRYRLELERDDVLKIVMKDINNYCEILKTSKGKQVNFKGGCFAGCPDIKIHEDGRLETIYKDSYKANSMIIIGEAVLKYLLFDIPIEKTINNCNDIFKFMQISHLGSTYEKCVQESPNGDIELQRNNRIYAGLKPSGTIIKVKPNGRRDSLANCPPNPIVDNANKLTINDINKQWYIEMATLRVNDFMGVPRLESLKKDELVEQATKLGLEFDKKIKKIDLIELTLVAKLQENGSSKDELLDLVKENYSTNPYNYGALLADARLQHKIQELRKKIRATEFILDKELPNNLGGGEYHSIKQYYNAIQTYCIELGLGFKFETVNLINFERDCTKPSNGLPIHVATIQARATLKDIDTGCKEEYYVIGQGSDTIDKAVSGAETMAFRQWFSKNFTPTNADDEDLNINEEPKSEPPKVSAYIPETNKRTYTK